MYCIKSGYGIEQAGWAVAIYGAGSLAGAFLGGKISDAIGFYYVQFFALFGGGILFIILGQTTSFLSFAICVFFLSLVNESFRPANAAAIAHYSTPQNTTQSFSLVRLAVNIGFGLGTAVGGFLASIDYHLLFWVDGCTSICAAIFLLLILPRVNVVKQKDNQVKKNYSPTAGSPYRDKKFLWFLLFQLLFAICFFQLFSTVPIFFKLSLGLDEFWIGAVMCMNGLLIAFFEMIIVFKLEGRHAYLKLIYWGTLLMGLSFLLLNIPLASGLAIASFSILTITIAEMLGMPFMNSYYISRSTQANRGQYAALYTMAWSAAQIIGSYGGTKIAALAGYNNLWWIISGICLVAGTGYFWLYKNHQ
ncbi:MAG: MFS transporter [Chitinophagaceae bacterium]|nr:MFS transporter [Chitinophagaceae bacterium]